MYIYRVNTFLDLFCLFSINVSYFQINIYFKVDACFCEHFFSYDKIKIVYNFLY